MRFLLVLLAKLVAVSIRCGLSVGLSKQAHTYSLDSSTRAAKNQLSPMARQRGCLVDDAACLNDNTSGRQIYRVLRNVACLLDGTAQTYRAQLDKPNAALKAAFLGRARDLWYRVQAQQSVS